MSEVKHTPGLLHVTPKDGVYGGRMIITDSRIPCIAEVMHEDAEANARRLVACWNACQRFDTDLLERVARPGSFGIHPAPQDRIEELLEALQPFAALMDAIEYMGGTYAKSGPVYSVTSHIGGHREITVEQIAAARAAIARATGAAS